MDPQESTGDADNGNESNCEAAREKRGQCFKTNCQNNRHLVITPAPRTWSPMTTCSTAHIEPPAVGTAVMAAKLRKQTRFRYSPSRPPVASSPGLVATSPSLSRSSRDFSESTRRVSLIGQVTRADAMPATGDGGERLAWQFVCGQPCWLFAFVNLNVKKRMGGILGSASCMRSHMHRLGDGQVDRCAQLLWKAIELRDRSRNQRPPQPWRTPIFAVQ